MGWLDLLTQRWRTRSTGRRGETLAVAYLRSLGYRILGANLRNRFGEIDILAEAPDGWTIAVVEVKTRERALRGSDPLPPEVRVNTAKRQQLSRLASRLMQRYKLADRPIRFDVIGVVLNSEDEPTIRHHIAAFEACV